MQQIKKKNEPIKEKFFLEESVVFTFPHQTNGNYVTESKTVGHVISERHWESTFDVGEIVNNYGLERGTAWKILRFILPIFSETINTILKIFSQHDFRKVT